MINVLICGINSEMGKSFYNATKKFSNEINVVSAVAKSFPSDIEADLPIYRSFDEVKEVVDVVVDFSCPEMLSELLQFSTENGCAIVEGTQGLSDKQKDQIKECAKIIPIFLSVNISIGVNSLMKLCLNAAKDLRDFDIEIIEEHQATKANAPSMTAKLIANTINESLGRSRKIISGRKGNDGRPKDEICIHSVRGGGLAGETRVMFIGEFETITIIHSAHSKFLFSQGACDIVKFIVGKTPKVYNLADYFKN